MSHRNLSGLSASPVGDDNNSNQTNTTTRPIGNLHHRTDSSSSKASSTCSASMSARDLILLTPCPVEPGHTLITIVRLSANEWKPEMRANAAYVAEGDNAGIVINKPANIMDYNRIQAGQKERIQPPSAKMSFKVFLTNPDTNKLTLEHRTLRFWLDQESSQIVQAYFCKLIGSKPDDFPKNYVGFLMKLMRILKDNQFFSIVKMEVELRQLAQDDSQAKPPSPVSSIDGSQSGRGSPLTSQKVLDIIESSYPNPISITEICSTTQTDEAIVRQLVEELAVREKINSTDDGQHYTRTTKPIDTKVNMVKQMPKVIKSQQPVIAIITAQYCEKLAVDSMISDKETFVRYRVSNGPESGQMESSSNYVYTLGNIGDHRVVSTKLTSVGHSRGALIAAGNATTRLLGTFPEIEYVFMVGCGGGVANFTNFASHVRLGDIVVSHLPGEAIQNLSLNDTNLSQHNPIGTTVKGSSTDFVYVHCRPKQQDKVKPTGGDRAGASIPVSYSVHKNLKRAVGGVTVTTNGSLDRAHNGSNDDSTNDDTKNSSTELKPSGGDDKQATLNPLTFDECHFRLWRPVNLELQKLAQRLWSQGLENPTHRIWNYYIDEGIETLRHQDIEATRPTDDTDKLYMSIGMNDTIEVNHPEAADDEIDLRREGRPMCHFGPIGSGRPALASEPLKQQMISEFNLRAFDSEFDPVVESIYGNRKERYIMIRGISDYRDGRKKKEWQQYSALVAAAFMKSIIVNLKPLD